MFVVRDVNSVIFGFRDINMFVFRAVSLFGYQDVNMVCFSRC